MISNAMIQKWIKMLRHDSVLHVEQSEGKHYSVSEIAGYYNNFSGKIESTKNFDAVGIPQNIASHGNEKKRCIFLLPSFSMVWEHMISGLKQGRTIISLPF